MHVVINNGNGRTQICTGFNSDPWSQLFAEANNLNENDVWLYAYQTGNKAAILNFCLQAWQSEWMYRWNQQITTYWACSTPNPCTNCIWPNGGHWYIVAIYYNGGNWLDYSNY